MKPEDRLIVALDVPSADDARSLVRRLGGTVGMFKVGNQLFTEAGPGFVHELVGEGERVFLDLKYHDIPTTVFKAVESACRLGVSLVDVHALGGRAMMEAARDAVPVGGPGLVAVTILTSHDQRSLEAVGIPASVEDQVGRLAALAKDSRLDGVVASPKEVSLLRQAFGPDFVIVTPGIRPSGSGTDDQQRAATPLAAVKAGATFLVVGRPITEATDPAGAAKRIVEEMLG